MPKCSRCKKDKDPLHKRKGAVYCKRCLIAIGEVNIACGEQKAAADHTIFGFDVSSITNSAQDMRKNKWWKGQKNRYRRNIG